MKVAELLERRRANWQELEQLCDSLATKRKRKLGSSTLTRFAALYRAACADLALADAYQLPPNTVQYLHRLVGRAHNKLYRSRRLDPNSWAYMLLVDAPQRIFHDRCVQFSFFFFWGFFILCAVLVNLNVWPELTDQLVSAAKREQMEAMFSDPIEGRPWGDSVQMAAFYIQHNTGIGLQCFAGGLLVFPGLVTMLFNAAELGASFGYMFRPEVAAGENFRHFVTAHGPFELTAICLAAGSGLRLGMGWISTNGMTRLGSLEKTAKESMPMLFAMIILFFLAAMIEGFVSPSSLPYGIKVAVAIVSTLLLLFYFVVLGFPRSAQRAT